MFGVLFFCICLSYETLKTMKQKLQDLIINVTVPLAWMAIVTAFLFCAILLPQIFIYAICK
jgi:hypothetical protein